MTSHGRSKAAFRAHRKAHEAVINTEPWYQDGPPDLGKGFTAAETAERRTHVLEILLRAAKRASNAGDDQLAKAYRQLHEKLERCRRRDRCGSQACPNCARAFQRAKTAAQAIAIAKLAKANPRKKVVLVTIIPPGMTYRPGDLHRLNVTTANRWLKDTLRTHGIRRLMLGSGDVGWETRRNKSGYFQYHWHLVMLTRNPDRLERKLKLVFPRRRKYERPVDVTEPADRNFLPYQNKVVKLPALLRSARLQLPELLLFLDRNDPLDLMVLRRFSIKAQPDGFAIQLVARPKR
jgi:hypothetical protein